MVMQRLARLDAPGKGGRRFQNDLRIYRSVQNGSLQKASFCLMGSHEI